MEDDKAFEVIESRAEKFKPTRKHDGFSRQDVVNSFAHAFKMIGGVQRLALWANENPDKFFPLYAKLLPATTINFGDNALIQIVHAIPPTPLDDHDGNPQRETVQIHSDDRQLDHQGEGVSIQEAFRSPEEALRLSRRKQGTAISNSLHTKGLAVDLNLYRDGQYLPHTNDHLPIGLVWEAMGGSWGGRFNDGNHYSLEHEGVR